jgi:uncharacterized membrane protein
MSGLYELLLAVHVLAATIWVGGSFATQFLAIRTRRRGPAAIGPFAKDVEWYGQRFNLGASLILILAAFGLVAEGNWSLGDPWISIALAAWIISFILGAGYLGPTSKKVGQQLEASGGTATPETAATIDRLFLVSRIELALLLIVVVDMVVKPGA